MEFVHVDWELDEATGELFAVLCATDVETHVDKLSVKNAMQSNGYDSFFMEEGAVDALLRQVEQRTFGRCLIAQRKDAEVTVTVSADAMQASISTTPSYGGQALDEERLRAAVQAKQIAYAICDRQSIAQALNSKSVTDLPLAEGSPMQRGRDSEFVPLVESVVDVPLTEDAAGRVNFREILEFMAVEPGTPLMRLESPSAGINGADVYGRVIPPEPGTALNFPTSVPGAIVDPRNPTVMVAEISGHPLVLDNCVQVDNVLTLDAVDVSTGNVAFAGSVLVKGDVASGSNLQASGDVIVKGIVDQATIEAGNNIEVAGGVFGEQSDEGEVGEFSAHLTAGGNISALFMSATFASAAKVVAVREYIAHCDVTGKRGIHLGQAGGKGYVIGGRSCSDKEILANVLGTDANVPTSVCVGYGSKLRLRYNRLQGQLSKLVEEQAALQATLQQEAKKPRTAKLPDADMRRRSQRIANTLKLWDADILRIGKDIVSMRERIDALEHARVVVKQRLHANTLLEINGQLLKIKARRESGGCYVCRGESVQLADE